MPTYEGLRLKIQKPIRKKFANLRKKKLKQTDFTILSNNCWAGMLYESYNLPKQTPTVGLFFMASDYIKFLSYIKKYLSIKPEFISPEQSKWKSYFKNNDKFGSFPIARLDDIEIFFLHYHSEKEAEEKWQRRIQRINWDKLIVKFNDQNGCTKEDIDEFFRLPFKNKLFFSCKKWNGISDEAIYIKQPKRYNQIMASYEPFGRNRYVDLTGLINSI
ncbi:MAG: DUF1919 domain-containing protein [Suilimivivens sp.]